MIIKTITITLVIILNLVILCGCIEQSNNNSNVEISLDKLRLNLDDLYEEDYVEVNEVHKTSEYIAPNGTTFEGWLIKEKYEIFFVKNSTSFIAQALVRLSSEEKAEELIENINTVNLSFNFTVVSSETIGEKTYLGKNISNSNGVKTQLYFLAFKIKNIVVVLWSSYISKDVIIDYAKIIEKNINNNIS